MKKNNSIYYTERGEVKALKDPVVAFRILIAVACILFIIDWSLSTPIYEMLLDNTLLGYCCGFGMAGLIAILPKVIAKAFVKKQYLIAASLVALTFALIVFIYFGQRALVIQRSQDPLTLFLAEDSGVMVEVSNHHELVTGLTTILFLVALAMSYLYATHEDYLTSKRRMLFFDRLFRGLSSNIFMVKGNLKRIAAKPELDAESRVHDQLRELEAKERELRKAIAEKTNAKQHEMNFLSNIRDRVKIIISNAYAQ